MLGEEAESVEKPHTEAGSRDARAILQSAALQIKVLRTYPLEERIAKLESLLIENVQVAQGMERPYELYKAAIQRELDDAKALPEKKDQLH